MTHDELLGEVAVKDVRPKEGLAPEEEPIEEVIAAVHASRREESAHKFARLEGVATR